MTDVPTRAAPKKQKGATAKAAAPAVIHLDYELAELPSAQHRAGLAGLVLMVRWLDRNPDRRKGTLALSRVDAHGATLSLDLEGLQALFDETYAATRISDTATWPVATPAAETSSGVNASASIHGFRRTRSRSFEAKGGGSAMMMSLNAGAFAFIVARRGAREQRCRSMYW